MSTVHKPSDASTHFLRSKLHFLTVSAQTIRRRFN